MIWPATDESIRRAAELLKSGSVVAIPTETVYGLACCIDQPQAIARVFQLKGRPADNPLIVHVHSVDQARDLTEPHDHAILERLAGAFWPGPLTIVLHRSAAVSDNVTGGLDTVALRMPAHPVALELLRQTACPLAAPSANISGRPSPTRAEHVEADFGHDVVVVDAGPCDHGLESTVVRVLESECIILRQGALSKQQLEAVLSDLQVRDIDDRDQANRSPGTRYRHYAPSARVILCDTPEEALSAAAASNGDVVVLTSPDTAGAHPELRARVLTPATLFDEFRRADGLQVESIVVLCDAEISSHAAMMNRLRKASEVSDLRNG